MKPLAILLCLTIFLLYLQPASAFPVGGIVLNLKKAAYITFSNPDSTNVAQELEEIGYSVDIIAGNSVSVDFLKFSLFQYEVLFFRLPAFSYKRPYGLLTGEKVANLTDYANDIEAGRLYVVEGRYAITEKFFSHYYAGGGLNNALVFLIAPSMSSISRVLVKECEASSIIGFTSPYLSLSWGFADLMIYHIVHHLCGGMTVKQAVMLELEQITKNRYGNQPPYDSLAYYGNGELTLKNSL